MIRPLRRLRLDSGTGHSYYNMRQRPGDKPGAITPMTHRTTFSATSHCPEEDTDLSATKPSGHEAHPLFTYCT